MTTIDAGVAQLVELHVANVVVAGSSPVSRSVHEESPVRPCGPTGFFASIVASRFMNRKLIAKSQNHFGSTVLGLPFLAYPGALLFAVFLVGCGAGSGEPEHTIIPLPASVEWTVADTFHFTEETRILLILLTRKEGGSVSSSQASSETALRLCRLLRRIRLTLLMAAST